MKKLLWLPLIAFMMGACTDDIKEPRPNYQYVNLQYVYGYINDSLFFDVRDAYAYGPNINMSIDRPPTPTGRQYDRSAWISFAPKHGSIYQFDIRVSPFSVGEHRYKHTNVRYNWEPDGSLVLMKSSGKKLTTYYPSERDFILEITEDSYDKGTESCPAVSGKLNGVLYNLEDKRDSVVVRDMLFGFNYIDIVDVNKFSK